MKNLQLNPQMLYEKLKARAIDEGAYTKEAWDMLAEQIVEERLDVGEMDVAEDSEGLEETLKSRWSEFSQEIEAR